ncbi:MAG TPA: sulfotransferase [Chitinophagaceae bacterium]|jgi:hypothetical protein
MKRKFLLIDISLFELTRRLLNSGGISVRGLFILFIYYLKFLFALPGTFLQFLFYARQIKKTAISKDPVFILGHYRSGTTYLQKLMISDKRFGYLSNYDMICPNSSLLLGKSTQQLLQFLINKLKIKNAFFNNDIVQLSEPCEEDRYLVGKGSAFTAYWGFVFPRRWHEWLNCSQQFRNARYLMRWKKKYLSTLKFITFRNKGRQLVLKNPPNTERIRYLLEMFPNAKFVYIYRNPFHLFYSMKNIWIRAVRTYYCLQKISDIQIEEVIFSHFEYLVKQYERDKKLIPAKQLIEVQYEELEAEPLNVLKRIYSELSLPDFEMAKEGFLSQLEKEKRYKKFQYEFTEDTFKKVEERWATYIHQWSYQATELII